MEAGFSTRLITPDLGAPLAGRPTLGRRQAERIRDPLHARALWLREGGVEAVIVAADLVLVTRRLALAVAGAAGIPAQNLFLCATHTHSGPGGYFGGALVRRFMGAYDERTFTSLVDALAGAALDARRDAAPAEISAASVALPGASTNRRRIDGPTDPTIAAVRCVRTARAPILLFSFGAHAVAGMRWEPRTATADYPGEVCRRLDARGIAALFLQGAVAAASPVPLDEAAGLDDCINAMADTVEAGLQRMDDAWQPLTPGGLSTALVPLDVHPRRCRLFPPAARWSRAREAFAAPLRWMMESLGRDGLADNQDPALALLRLGGLVLLGVPAEAGPSVIQELRSALLASGAEFALPVSLCGCHLGYTHMRAEYEHVPPRGSAGLAVYENAMSLGGWDLGDRIVEAARTAAART